MPTIEKFTTSEASPVRLAAIRRLLDSAFRGRFTEDDWDHALGGRHVVVVDQDTVIAHASVVPRAIDIDGRRFAAGYVEAVATDPARRNEGHGSAAMAEAAAVIHDGLEVGVLSTGHRDFYARLGWESWRGPSYVRVGSRVERTAEDDDGIMVLRFGPSATIDLSGSISCDARDGDVW